MSDRREMPFLDHLEELRWRLVRSLAAIVIFFILAFIYSDFLFDKILFGPTDPNFWTYRMLCKISPSLCVHELKLTIFNPYMFGQLTTQLVATFIAGLVCAFPYLLWEIWQFVKPALYEKEIKYTRGVVFWASFLFILGVLFGYFIICPTTVNFIANYIVFKEADNRFFLNEYVSTISFLTLISGVLFELPLVIYFLAKIGIMTPAFMRHYRSWAIVAIFILAALITPTTDMFTMLVVALPLILLYEASIIVAAAVERKKVKKIPQ